MQLALDATDLAALDDGQRDAVLMSLFVALIADGAPSAEELARFEETVAALPWGKDRAHLQQVTRATGERLAHADDAGKATFLRELAAAIPGQALREKVVLDMAAVMAADGVATIVERNALGAFVLAFGLDPERTLAQIKARIPMRNVARELGLELEAADLASLDDGQKLAVLEALVTGVLADGKASPAELRRFDQVVGALPWGMEPAIVHAEIKGVSQRIASLRTPGEISDFILGMAGRLPSQPLREKVFYTVATIMFADGDANQLEQNTLGALVFAFAIPSERLAAVKQAVTGRTTPAPAPQRPAS
ncbi:MAG TPA: hypothetical protein VHE35_00810 [Kofleriaceae bacterium]|nr:hypothetical protein [Kofleriaceae bacterium]